MSPGINCSRTGSRKAGEKRDRIVHKSDKEVADTAQAGLKGKILGVGICTQDTDTDISVHKAFYTLYTLYTYAVYIFLSTINFVYPGCFHSAPNICSVKR